MNKYINNLFYLIRHKYNVAIECIKMGMFLHAITHDLSKLLPSEFIPYTNNFHGGSKSRRAMNMAWTRHKNRNPHHWDYWVKGNGDPIPMPDKYVRQLIADWKGIGKQKGFDDATIFYIKNKYKMNLHKETIKLIEGYILHTKRKNNWNTSY